MNRQDWIVNFCLFKMFLAHISRSAFCQEGGTATKKYINGTTSVTHLQSNSPFTHKGNEGKGEKYNV